MQYYSINLLIKSMIQPPDEMLFRCKKYLFIVPASSCLKDDKMERLERLLQAGIEDHLPPLTVQSSTTFLPQFVVALMPGEGGGPVLTNRCMTCIFMENSSMLANVKAQVSVNTYSGLITGKASRVPRYYMLPWPA